MIRPVVLIVAALGAGFVGPPQTLHAQDLSTIGGGFVGAGAGVWLSVAYITTQARRGDSLDSEEEAAGMAAIPLFAGLTAGLTLGAFADDRMPETLTWGAVGWVSGMGIGALVGDRVWDDPQRRWAGAVIGGAVGMIVGGVTGFATSGEDDRLDGDGFPIQFRLTF